MTSREFENEARLRVEAENRLKSGTAPAVPDSWTVGPDALGMLYQLASSGDSAADALKLLHELQVHQVELGLQHEQMIAADREMAESLEQCRDLFEWAPLGYLMVGLDGAVMDVNRAGVSLLGVGRQAAVGRNFAWFLSNESRSAIRDLFDALSGPDQRASCQVRFNHSGLMAHIAASVPPSGDVVLMIVSEQQGSGEA